MAWAEVIIAALVGMTRSYTNFNFGNRFAVEERVSRMRAVRVSGGQAADRLKAEEVPILHGGGVTWFVSLRWWRRSDLRL